MGLCWRQVFKASELQHNEILITKYFEAQFEIHGEMRETQSYWRNCNFVSRVKEWVGTTKEEAESVLVRNRLSVINK